MKIDTNIKFTPQEQETINIIKEVISKYAPGTRAFIVGGLIRDRLVGLPSHDLDLMISPLKAEAFAKLITKHLNIKDPHVIKENPEKSRYISTSKIYLPTSYGIQEIDIAQARQDVYKGDSRIPETKPATPEEDMSRRDFTVNCLAFDILENKIVDFTGMGIKDLISNTIRTPQDPLKTFSEDPLRIFRAIVYAAKLNAKIDPPTYNAMLDPSLREEIKSKVSKERLGIEFLKMMKNPNPEYALKLLKDTGLFNDIIVEALKGSKYEGKLAELDMSQNNPHHKLTLWQHSMQTVKNVLDKYPNTEPEKRAVMILSALMHDLGKLYKGIWGESKSHPGSRSFHGHEEISKEMSELILRYIRVEGEYLNIIPKLIEFHMRPHVYVEQKEGGTRSLRKFLRNTMEANLDWLDVFNLAVSDAYSKDVIRDPNTVREYRELEQRLQDALLSLSPTSQSPSIKPILNGNEIMSILNIKPGAHMKDMMEFVKELKDENPDITKEEATQKLKDKYQKPNPAPEEIRQASKDKDKTSSLCPMHLLKTKIADINKLFEENKHYEILTIINQLKEEYGNDENINRLMAVTVFKLLLKSEKYRYNNLIQFILDKAEENFFDSVLCSYVIGILILIETGTEDDIIREMVKRVIKMSPETLRNVINLLPQMVYRTNLKKEIEVLLK